MKRVPAIDSNNMTEFLVNSKNNLAIYYIDEIINEYYKTNLDYDKNAEQDVIFPGRITLNIDGIDAIIDISLDTLMTLKRIIEIGNYNISTRFKEEDYVDLRKYNQMYD